MSHARYPRLLDKERWLLKRLAFFRKLLERYPPPRFDGNRDGHHNDHTYNPANWILSSFLTKTRQELQALCEKHALVSDGDSSQCIRRMYLHWMWSRQRRGKVYYGYDKKLDFNYTRTPTCACGSWKAEEMEKLKQEREKRQEQARRQKSQAEHRRFPRLQASKDGKFRFPREKEA